MFDRILLIEKNIFSTITELDYSDNWFLWVMRIKLGI
jgi:hypothetical protein